MSHEKKNETTPRTRSKTSPRSWTVEDKLRLLFEAGQLSNEELGAFLRREGLHEAQLDEWRATVSEALSSASSRKAPRVSPERKRVRELEKELDRKNRALAEVAALLALKKKAQQIWGDEDDDTTTKRGT